MADAFDEEILTHYADEIREHERLLTGGGALELIRTQDLLRRYLPPPPATPAA